MLAMIVAAEWANRRNGDENLSLAGGLDHLDDLCIQFVKVLLQRLQFSNDLFLLDHETFQAPNIFCPNALVRQRLQFHQLFVAEFSVIPSRCLQGRYASCSKCLWCGELLPNGEGRQRSLHIWVNSGNTSSQIAMSLFLRCAASWLNSYR